MSNIALLVQKLKQAILMMHPNANSCNREQLATRGWQYSHEISKTDPHLGKMRLDLVILLDGLLKFPHVQIELPGIFGVALMNYLQDARGFSATVSTSLVQQERF